MAAASDTWHSEIDERFGVPGTARTDLAHAIAVEAASADEPHFDTEAWRAVAERALTRQGYKVVTAGNGEEALECLETGESFDLLISDVVMPTMDGPTLVRHARQKYPELPILFMSGYAEEQLRKSIDIERVAFLPKPFSVQQLAEAARTALTRK